MNWDLLALLGNLINAVGNIGDVELKIEAAWFGVPKGESSGKIRGEVLWQAWAVLND